jgi:hypothetical protein
MTVNKGVLLVVLLFIATAVFGQITAGSYVDNEGLLYLLKADGTCTIENRAHWGPLTWQFVADTGLTEYDVWGGAYPTVKNHEGMLIIRSKEYSDWYLVYRDTVYANQWLLSLVVSSIGYNAFLPVGLTTWFKKVQ